MSSIKQNYTVQEKLTMLRKQYADIKKKEKDNQRIRHQKALRGSASETQLWLYADGMDKINYNKRLQEEKMKKDYYDSSYAEPRSVTSSDRCDHMYRVGVNKIREKREMDHSSLASSYTESESTTSSDRCDRMYMVGVEKIRAKREKDQSSSKRG